MTIVRRLTSFLLAAALLYVNVERVNIFCGKHGAVTAAHSGAVAPDGEAHDGADPHANGHHAPAQSTDHEEHDESPVHLDCCQHMAACGMMSALRADRLALSAIPRAAKIRIASQHEPAAWDTAPPAPPPWA